MLNYRGQSVGCQLNNAHPNDEIARLFAALEEALPGLRVGMTAITNADLTGHRLAAVQCFAAVAINEFQMREAAEAQVKHPMDPPIRPFAGWLAQSLFESGFHSQAARIGCGLSKA